MTNVALVKKFTAVTILSVASLASAQASTVDWLFTGTDVVPAGGLSQHYSVLATGGQPVSNESFTVNLSFDTSMISTSLNTGNLPTGGNWSYYAASGATFSITEGGNTANDGIMTFAIDSTDQQLAFNNTAGNTVYFNLAGFSGLSNPASLATVNLSGVTGTIGSDDFGEPVLINSAQAVPLPAGLPLLLSGVAGLGVMVRRRRIA